MKKRNVFAPLTGIKSKYTEVASTKHAKNERWLFGVLSADDDVPTVEEEKKVNIFYSLFLFGSLFFLLLFGRSFFLQIYKGHENLVAAEENRFRPLYIRAPRGLFYDCNKTPLVKNVPNYEVTVIPSDLPANGADREKIYNSLSKVIGIPTEEIKRLTEQKEDQGPKKKPLDQRKLTYSQSLLISKSVSRDVSLVFESKKNDLQGFYVETNPIREYLDNGLLSHVFGYVGRISEDELKKNPLYRLTDFIGKSGLEKSYEQILKGQNGEERVEVDSSGKVIRTFGEKDPVLGDNLMLSIDFELQKKLTENLTKQMERAKVKKAAAIAVNPQNGEILAFVSLPTYDNNLFAKGISEADYKKLVQNPDSPLLNRVISGEYPSGSIIKPFFAAAGLQEGVITEATTVLSSGGIKVGEWEFPDWKAGGHGVTNVTKAIAESVNTFFYAIAGGYQNIRGLGPELMKKYLERFGFGQSVDVDIAGSAEGNIPDPEWKERVQGQPWYLGDTYHFGIGQGDLLITPIQMAEALQAIANGGTEYKLHILKAVMDSDGRTKSEKSPEVIRKDIVSAQTVDIVRRGMRQTVLTGSGRALSSLPVSSAAKTGTAQYGSNNEKKHAWFTVFAPYENAKIEMVILLEGAGEGSDFAAPVANDTLKWYFSTPR